EQEAGECGMHPADLRIDPVAAQTVIQRFVALGYMQPPGEDQAKAVEMAVREQHYNLARSYLDARRYPDALPLLQELVKKSPDETRFSQYLAQCLLALRRRAEAKAILEQLISNPPKPAPKEENEVAPPDQEPAAEVSKAEAETPAETPRATPAVTSNENPWADLLMGAIHFEEGNMDEALASLLKAERANPRLPDLHLRIGDVYLRQKRTDD